MRALANEELREKGLEQALRRFVSKTGRGCVKRLTLPGRGQLSGCLHIKRQLFSEQLLNNIDEGKEIEKMNRVIVEN
ncbi:hypothetical protein OS493_018471 [Desmophyllum pertusum]|uniref:Uncharacterized protein n=1 Tax=Desmophyllum pertusum TaxID=174260 RepID=A0A9X0A0V9_9CNID|nr:hypothetical protein OS493_018471 [Desmophyllum pertusum]